MACMVVIRACAESETPEATSSSASTSPIRAEMRSVSELSPKLGMPLWMYHRPNSEVDRRWVSMVDRV